MTNLLSSPDLPRSARLVIIGGGIVGCSTAYHLSRLGWRDIVMLDQGPLFNNWGSTSHAPGLIFQHNNSRAVCELAQWTIQTYQEIAPRASNPAFFSVGSLEIAGTRARRNELKRKLGNAKAWGLEAHLLDNADVARMIPLLRTDDLHGAFYVPSDANVKATLLCEALAGAALETESLKVFENVSVSGIEKSGGRVKAVVTTNGRIQADLILCAAGIWGQEIGRMAGVDIPLTPMQHLYVRTEPLPELKGETQELRHPILREQDQDMYYRQHGEAYGFGSYGHAPLPVEIGSVPKRDNAAMLPFTPEHMDEAFRAARHRIPALLHAETAHAFNGIFSFTPDAQSILGEKPELKGFWVAEAVWVTHGGGVGRVMAEWLDQGLPPIDLREMDINRFAPHMAGSRFIHERSCQQYIEVYDIIHPLDQPRGQRNLRLSPCHGRLQKLGAHFFENTGWERPRWFESNQPLLEKLPPLPSREAWAARNWSPLCAAEHLACRERVGLFDLAPFAKFEVSGRASLEYLQHLSANNVDQPIGKAVYTAMLNERAGIKSDVTIVRLDERRFWVVTGSRLAAQDLAWLKRHLPDDESVHLADLSSAYGTIGLWGPQARTVLSRVTDADVSNAAFPYFTAQKLFIGQIPVTAVRISYVGELGWELYTPTEFGLSLWDSLWEVGQESGIVAVGEGAVDSLRLEKGYRAWGSDIHTDYNPVEAGLGFAVRLNKGEFIGRAALIEAMKAPAPARKLCCLILDDPHVVLMGKEPILCSGNVIGYVTSANFGYSVGNSIAYGYLPADTAEVGSKVEIYYFGTLHSATVSNEPLFDPKHARLRS